MLEVYSDNMVVASNTAIPLNSTSIQKGCTATRAGVDTIQLNKCGVYEITLDGFVSGDVGGTLTVQMRKDGVLQPQAVTSTTVASTLNFYPIGFTTLVQVDHNNSNCCCKSPVIIDFDNTGVGISSGHINVTVTRLC